MILRWTHIMLHHSLTEDGQTVSWQAIRRWHMGEHPDSPYRLSPMREIGYHFGVELVGRTHEVFAGRPLDFPGGHCKAANSFAIGVCVVGNFDTAPPSPQLFAKTVEYVRGLISALDIPVQNVIGHCDLDRKSCPGKYFDLERFRRQLSGI